MDINSSNKLEHGLSKWRIFHKVAGKRKFNKDEQENVIKDETNKRNEQGNVKEDENVWKTRYGCSENINPEDDLQNADDLSEYYKLHSDSMKQRQFALMNKISNLKNDSDDEEHRATFNADVFKLSRRNIFKRKKEQKIATGFRRQHCSDSFLNNWILGQKNTTKNDLNFGRAHSLDNCNPQIITCFDETYMKHLREECSKLLEFDEKTIDELDLKTDPIENSLIFQSSGLELSGALTDKFIDCHEKSVPPKNTYLDKQKVAHNSWPTTVYPSWKSKKTNNSPKKSKKSILQQSNIKEYYSVKKINSNKNSRDDLLNGTEHDKETNKFIIESLDHENIQMHTTNQTKTTSENTDENSGDFESYLISASQKIEQYLQKQSDNDLRNANINVPCEEVLSAKLSNLESSHNSYINKENIIEDNVYHKCSVEQLPTLLNEDRQCFKDKTNYNSQISPLYKLDDTNSRNQIEDNFLGNYLSRYVPICLSPVVEPSDQDMNHETPSNCNNDKESVCLFQNVFELYEDTADYILIAEHIINNGLSIDAIMDKVKNKLAHSSREEYFLNKHNRLAEENSKTLVEKIKIFFSEMLTCIINKRPLKFYINRQCKWSDFRLIDSRLVNMSTYKKMVSISFNAKRSQKMFKMTLLLLGKIVHMLSNGLACNKREIYYQYINYFKSQKDVDKAVENISKLLNAPPWELGIFATSKGLIYGNIKIIIDSETTYCGAQGGTIIPQNVDKITNVETDAEFILIVEKDSIFQKLLDENLPKKLKKPFIIITGKGVPDLNTRRFVKVLKEFVNIPIHVLVDGDPYGIDIMLMYKYGSLSSIHISDYLVVPDLKWIGIYPSEIRSMTAQCKPLSEHDQKKLKDLLKRPYIEKLPEIKNELLIMQEMDRKAEIESFIKYDNYLSDIYLPHKYEIFFREI